MKFGLIPVNIMMPSLDAMVQLAQATEKLGFESLWTFEHVIVPADYSSQYPYNKSGNMGAPPETPFLDPLIALSAIAAATSSIRLGTGVNIVSQTNPLMLAKQCASLDFISNGRFMLGPGIGWLREEFEAMGTPFERRGARFDDYMVALRKVWSGEMVEHQSDFLNWHGFKSFPLPVQKPRLPIIMGGNKGKIFRRIAQHGDGWFIPPCDLETLTGQLDELRAACAEENRNYDEIELTAFWDVRSGKDGLQALADLGVSRAVVPITAISGGNPEALQEFAEAYIAK